MGRGADGQDIFRVACIARVPPTRSLKARNACMLPSRSEYMGTPSLYDTFIDESLNYLLRLCAERSHRTTMERSVFQCFEVLGRMKTVTHLYGNAEAGDPRCRLTRKRRAPGR